MAKSLSEDHVPMFRDPFLQFLLQVSATMLILAQRWNFALKILQTRTRKAVNWKTTMFKTRISILNCGPTFTIHVSTLVFRSMQSIHLVVGISRVASSRQSEAVTRAIVMIQGCRAARSIGRRCRARAIAAIGTLIAIVAVAVSLQPAIDTINRVHAILLLERYG